VRRSILAGQEIPTRYNERKTAAAAGVLLREAGGRMEYLRLLKLLYMADRESWDRYGRPITGDDYVSMDHGPVLSETYNRIKDEGTSEGFGLEGWWEKTVERVSRYDVRLAAEPDLGPLSPAEVRLLKDTYDLYRDFETWPLVRHLHRILKEWTNPKGSSINIFPEDILKALGKPAKAIEDAREEAEEQAQLQRLLGR
jgi:hypothetical protein